MSIHKYLPELLQAGVINQDTADRIRDYYKNKSGTSTNRLFIVFGILGAILVGLGIILIIAHNWDELSRSTKTIFAFLPLLVGQGFCIYTLLKKQESVAWRESTTAFLFFSVGASISLVSQIYNIPGNLSSFLLTWMLLCLPLVYFMKSSIASLLYLAGITYYACETNYWSYSSTENYFYWLFLILVLPHYYLLYKEKPKSNFMTFHNWLIPLSVVITLGTVADTKEELMFIAYFSLFGILYLISESGFFSNQKTMNNGFRIIGSLGTIVLLLVLSFDWFWSELIDEKYTLSELVFSVEFFASSILSLVAAVLLYLKQKGKALKHIRPVSAVFLLFIVVFISGMFLPVATLLINLIVFALGIWMVRDGAKQDHLGILNYGLIIITALVICRFFDTDLSFVFRGVLFVAVGAGFFVANYSMLKKRKTNEIHE